MNSTENLKMFPLLFLIIEYCIVFLFRPKAIENLRNMSVLTRELIHVLFLKEKEREHQQQLNVILELMECGFTSHYNTLGACIQIITASQTANS